MITYETYCEGLKKFNQPIIFTEDEYERKYGDPIKEEKPVETRRKEPTLKLSISEPKAKIKKPPKPVIIKAPRVRDRSKEKPRPTKTNRKMVAPKLSTKHLSPEELKAHKSKIAREWRARRKEEGILPKIERTDEVRKKSREYYANNQAHIMAKTNAYRKKAKLADPDFNEKARIRMQNWRDKNKERANDISRNSKKRCKEKQAKGLL